MGTHRSRNIAMLYIIKTAKWFMLMMPIVVLFYQENGLSMKDIFILQAVYSVSIVVLEIPSGYAADVWGRKNTLVTGAVLGFGGYLIYCFSHSFEGFLVAEIILGIGESFVSGADSAMLYDTLYEEKRQDEYIRYEGRVGSLGNFAESVAGILGGFLATMSLRTPVCFQALVAFSAIPAAFLLHEPERHRKLIKMQFRDILDISRYALHGNPLLKWHIIFSAVTGSATLTMAWFVQPFFKHVELPVSLFGVFWTALNLTVAFFSLYSYRIERRIGKRANLLMISLAIPLGFILLSLSGGFPGFIVLFTFYMVRGIATPSLKEYINRITASEIRATVLSIRNFIIRSLFALTGPLLGWMTDRISLQYGLLLAGILFMAAALVAFLFLGKHISAQSDSSSPS